MGFRSANLIIGLHTGKGEILFMQGPVQKAVVLNDPQDAFRLPDTA